MHSEKKINSSYVTVITCTRRLNYMDKVFDNFNNQKYRKKELIIILNNNQMKIDDWEERAKKYKNISVYQLDENKSLGECLNFGASLSKSEFIAKFDDDDYYGPKYLSNSMKVFKRTDAGVIGKSASFVYFEENGILAVRNLTRENCYVNHVDGPTLIIKHDIFDLVQFRDITRGEDVNFCKDCREKGIKIYASNKYNHVYVRHASIEDHTWTIANKELLRRCKVIAKNVQDYRDYSTLKLKDRIIQYWKYIVEKFRSSKN